jgi:hypothetical protein
VSAEPGQGGPGRIAVRPELVDEHLISPLHSRAMALLEELDDDVLAEGWEEARRALAPEATGNDEAERLALSLARAGYAAREAEVEAFESAGGRFERLSEAIASRTEAGENAAAARRGACLELALSEPEQRPETDSGAVSWLVPGPGAHVRHLLALRAADQLLGEGGRPPKGLERRRDVKRCWLYGLLMRCSEEGAGAGP